MEGLNPQQQEAVRYSDGPLLVLAGAGSGKTRVITRKIVHLVRNCGYEPQHITAVTFTNKAAREMRERVGVKLSRKESGKLTVCTFHRLGLSILRRDARRAGLGAHFCILDPDDALGLIREIIGEDDEKLVDWAGRLQGQISEWKNELVLPATARKRAETPGEARLAEWYERYETHLQARNAVDLDDLILRCVRMFQDDEEALRTWRGRMRYLLVDEYQDTNSAQYELVRLLAGSRGRLTVVGDDDQSIYAWRGARPDNLVRLEDDFPGLRVIKLEQNYRSTARILKAANQVISSNPHIFEKKLWSDLGYGPPIRIVPADNEEQEAENVATRILAHRLHNKTKFSEYAVLYRGNHQSRPVELALRRSRIPYRVSGGTSFFNRGEVRDLVAYLRLLANPDDDTAFLRVINTPRREIGPGTVEKLATYARERVRPLYAACNEMGLESRLPARAVERLRRFTGWLDHLREQAATADPVAAIREMIEDMDYEAWLFQNAGAKAAEGRMQNVNALVDLVAEAFRRDEDKDLEGVVGDLMLQDLLDRQDSDADDDRVHLLTLHAAKGLEFPCVFMIGMEEGLLPHRSCIEADDVTEERRLAYVGITRARHHLTLSYAASRKIQGKPVSTEPSRFLQELPEEDVEWADGDQADTDSLEERRRKGQARIADLHALLS